MLGIIGLQKNTGTLKYNIKLIVIKPGTDLRSSYLLRYADTTKLI